jgi:SSS family solute:Na+ symporter
MGNLIDKQSFDNFNLDAYRSNPEVRARMERNLKIAKAFADNWNPYVLSLTVPLSAIVAAVWFVPFYRNSSSVSAYSFLESRYGAWARLYASSCFLVMQSARSGVILFLTALLVSVLLGCQFRLLL